VERHPKASVFHTTGWLNALKSTYGYEPVVYTTSSPTGEVQNGLLFCCVNSWLTGNRLVSLPFSDHCEPLCDSPDDLAFLIRYLKATVPHQNWRYAEVRPININFGQINDADGFLPVASYDLHVLDLRRNLDELFQNLDKDSARRRIRRAARAGLAEKVGRSEDLLKDFYDLFAVTRRRHHLLPIPQTWFRNLIQWQGEAIEIRVAYWEKTPVSAILTLHFRNTAYYKYGCADARFDKFGGTPWLLWRAIAAAKSRGATRFDMGRTDEHDVGLVAFKNHWVPRPQRLTYWVFSENSAPGAVRSWKLKMAKRLFSCMPTRMLIAVGRLIYRHVA
jgi:hypothetical protein